MRKTEPLVFNCPVEAALEAIGGKWKPVILWHLSHGELRFGALKRAIPRVTEKVLIEQLRQLERSGVVARAVVETIPPAVTYSLTEHGRSLKEAIFSISAWGLLHAETIHARILIVDAAAERAE
ncbi:MAG: helix-turn-helix transcriptional regulator [Cytophagales bacterium]|nr:helix-turn-helix transcriptional regulator [Armatimonadota bacterium]